MELFWTAAMAMETADSSASEEGRLIEASRKGDERAFAELVRLHQRRVFRLASRFFRHPEEVEDAAQDTFLTIWRKLHTYRARAPFEHWLTRVCLNTCYERLRRAKPPPVPLVMDVAAPATDPDAGMEAAALLERLAPADRFVLQLLHAEEHSVAEIAERLGWSRSKVKVRAHRARARLRRLVEEAAAA